MPYFKDGTRCDHCEGTGSYDGGGNLSCHKCDGTGNVPYDPAVTAAKAGVDLGGNPLPKRLPIEDVINPWIPITDPHDLAALGKLAEEASELAKACNRAIIQGLDGTTPGQDGDNANAISQEIHDVEAALYVCRDRNLIRWPTMEDLDRRERKIEGFRKWHKLIDALRGNI